MVIKILLFLAAMYLLAGLVFAIVFVIKGIEVTDKNTRGSSVGFRIIIIPGAALLWPLLLRNWINAKASSHD